MLHPHNAMDVDEDEDNEEDGEEDGESNDSQLMCSKYMVHRHCK